MVQVEIIKKNEFQHDTTTPKSENQWDEEFKRAFEAIISFLYILRVSRHKVPSKPTLRVECKEW